MKIMTNENSNMIKTVLNDANLNFDKDTLAKLLFYFKNLLKWNANINLTSTATFDEAVKKHLSDTITSLPHLKGEKILDIGTGAGVPGLLIKILCPYYKIILVDAVRKKVSFLQFIITSLKLNEIQAFHGKIEKNKNFMLFEPYSPFDTIISQAVGEIKYISEISGNYLNKNGRIIVMKGKGVYEEIEKYEKILINDGWEITIQETKAPFVNLQRFLVILEKNEIRKNYL